MIRVIPISSGSKGNCTYIDFDGEAGTLLDCGVHTRIVNRIMYDNNLEKRITSVLVSHEHADHSEYEEDYSRFINEGNKVEILEEFELDHGEEKSLGRLLSYGDQKVLWLTDFSEISQKHLTRLSLYGNINLVLIEANYSERIVNSLIASGDVRALGNTRHHSNEKTVAVLKQLEWGHVHFLHLSEGTNNPRLIEKLMKKELPNKSYTIGNNLITEEFNIADLKEGDDIKHAILKIRM